MQGGEWTKTGEMYFDDYKIVEEMRIPKRIVIYKYTPQGVIKRKIVSYSIDVNVDIEDRIFENPSDNSKASN